MAGKSAKDTGVQVPEEVIRRRVLYGHDWAQWIAVEDIYYGGALAHKAGSPVPATNVKLHGWDKPDPEDGSPPKVKPVE